jgi:hypothetical protein
LERIEYDDECSQFRFNKALRELSLGNIGKNFLFALTRMDRSVKLKKLKLCFLPIMEEDYDEVYRAILYLVENFIYIKNFIFRNFSFKYKNIIDGDLRSILASNQRIRKVSIASDIPFHVENFEGFYYYEYPSVVEDTIIPLFRNHNVLSKIYTKKHLLIKIFDYFRVRKDKQISISYKI